MSGKLFSESEQQQIVIFARAVIGAELARTTAPAMPELPGLSSIGSCFVTLQLNGALRGCIGNIEAFETLGENLRRNALNAAFNDPRFPALTQAEFDKVEIEVSLLTPAEPISSLDEFVIGEHGIIFSLFGRRSVFLPQVPTEQGWDKETTLDFLSRKAGYAGNAWKSRDARFSVFKTEIYR